MRRGMTHPLSHRIAILLQQCDPEPTERSQCSVSLTLQTTPVHPPPGVKAQGQSVWASEGSEANIIIYFGILLSLREKRLEAEYFFYVCIQKFPVWIPAVLRLHSLVELIPNVVVCGIRRHTTCRFHIICCTSQFSSRGFRVGHLTSRGNSRQTH